MRSVRTECLDHVFIFNERHLEKVLAEYVGYFNHWRPHRQAGEIFAIPALGGLHHVYIDGSNFYALQGFSARAEKDPAKHASIVQRTGMQRRAAPESQPVNQLLQSNRCRSRPAIKESSRCEGSQEAPRMT